MKKEEKSPADNHGIKVSGEWISWETITVNELKAQLALGTLNEKELVQLLHDHRFNNEVTGWVYKYLHPFGRKNSSAPQWNGDNPYLFD